MANPEDPAEAAYAAALRTELDRRIAVLANEGEEAFGRLGGVDAIAIGLVCILAPALIVWCCR